MLSQMEQSLAPAAGGPPLRSGCGRQERLPSPLSGTEQRKRSLALQGAVFSAEQATTFIAQPGARDAVVLRQWDDLAKQADFETPSLRHFLERAARCAPTGSPAAAA